MAILRTQRHPSHSRVASGEAISVAAALDLHPRSAALTPEQWRAVRELRSAIGRAGVGTRFDPRCGLGLGPAALAVWKAQRLTWVQKQAAAKP